MATEAPVQNLTLEAGADLSAKQYHCVKLSSGKAVLCAAGEDALGVLQNKPSLGEAAVYMRLGLSKCAAAAAIAEGASVAAAADGRIETAGSGDYVIGKAKAAAAGAGSIISVELTLSGVALP